MSLTVFTNVFDTIDSTVQSTIIGNTVLEDGDIIYKGSDLFVSVIKKGELFDKYFEVIS